MLSAPRPLTTTPLRKAKMAEKKCTKCGETPQSFGNICWCKPCYNSWRREWRRNNPDLVKAAIERAKARDPERFKRYDRQSYWRHRDKRIAKSRRWNIENKEAFAAREAARRSIQKSATPAWADWGAIEAFYVDASRLTEATGVLHHVDHIVPLKSKIVCGLHVPWNLRVVTAFENQSKNNRHWPDMP